MVPFADGFKIAIAEPHESIPMSNENAPNLSKFYHLHEPIKLCAFVVETTANILHPFIDLERMLVTVDLKCLHLIDKIRLLGCTCYPRIGNRQSLFRCDHSTIGQILVMRIVAPVCRRAMGPQDAFAVPLL